MIQPKRACVFTATQPFTTDLINSNRDWFKYCWVWDKAAVTNPLSASRRPLACHEDVVVFALGQVIYNPQMSEGKQWHRGGKSKYESGIYAGVMLQTDPSRKDRYPKSIILASSADRRFLTNSTQKPVALFEYLIRTYTNEGDTVLDPTAGSMTTAIACLNTGRDYICIEKDPEEYRKGLARVQAHIAAPKQQSLLESVPEMNPVVAEQLSLMS